MPPHPDGDRIFRFAADGRGVFLTFAASEMAEGLALGVDPFGTGQDTHFVLRTPAGIFAYRDICPHLGDTGLAWRRDAYLNAQGDIQCSIHGARFDARTGLCFSGPCKGQSLAGCEVSMRDGTVTVRFAPLTPTARDIAPF